MHCASCGNLLPPQAKVCPNCGTRVPDNIPASSPNIVPSEQTSYGGSGSFQQEAGPTIPDSLSPVDKTVRQNPPPAPQNSFSSGYNMPPAPQEQFQFPDPPAFPSEQFQQSPQPPQPQAPFGGSTLPPQYQQPFAGTTPQYYSDTTQQDIPIHNQPSYPSMPLQSPSTGGQYMPFGQPAQSGQSGQMGYSGQAGQMGQQGPQWQPMHPVQQPQPVPRRRSTGLIIALVAAIVLVIAGSILIYYVGVARPAQLHAQATATVVTQLTSQAQGTAIANTHATGTAQAQANATTTAVAVATAQVQATTTAYVNMYTQAASGTPALTDPLTQNDSNDWYVHSSSTGACAFTGSALHVTGIGAFCTAQATSFANFAYQAKITVLKGSNSSGGGLMFRLDTSLLRYYVFAIGTDGSYFLALIQVTSSSKSTFKNLTTGFSPAIMQGLNQTNTIAILARGNNFYLYANNQFITQFADSSSATGAIGVFGVDNNSGLDVAFTNAEVWRA